MEKIKNLNREQIDEDKWLACLQNSSCELIYLNTWYLDSVSEKWSAYVLEESGKYIAALPYSWRVKKGIKYVYPPFFTQQLSVISTPEIKDAFQKAALGKITEDFKFIEYYLSGCKVKLNPNFNCEERINCELKLDESYDQIHSQFSSNHKRNLKKFHKANFSIQSDSKDIADIIGLFKLDRGKSISYTDKDYAKIISVCAKVQKKANLMVLKAYSERGDLIAGAVFFEFQNRVIFVFSGNSIQGKENAALFGLLDHAIKINAGQSKTFDFEGSQAEGLQKFYLGFGAKIVPYHFLKLNRLPLPLNLLKK